MILLRMSYTWSLGYNYVLEYNYSISHKMCTRFRVSFLLWLYNQLLLGKWDLSTRIVQDFFTETEAVVWLLQWKICVVLVIYLRYLTISFLGNNCESAPKINPTQAWHIMTSSNGNIFRVTGHLCGEFTGPRRIPCTKASDAELGCFLWSAPE